MSEGISIEMSHLGSSGCTATATHPLTTRHFVLQGELPADLTHVELAGLDPALRMLLFTDGTVTRMLEVQGLSRVNVEVVDQVRMSTPDDLAGLLEVATGRESVRRRVRIGAGTSSPPLIWAESHIVTDRLPHHFLGVLRDTPDGIGESLQQVRLESWRDLLWFGLGSPPRWSCAQSQPDTPVVTRLYRVISGGRPTLLISESFAVQRRGDTYHLNWST